MKDKYEIPNNFKIFKNFYLKDALIYEIFCKKMKIFIYKTLFVFILIFIVFHLTFGLAMNQLKKNMSKYFSEPYFHCDLKKIKIFFVFFIQKRKIEIILKIFISNFFDKIFY